MKNKKGFHFLSRTLFHVYPYPHGIGGGGNFGTVEDTTDHFGFYCRECKSIAIILEVRSVETADSPTVYFFLRCGQCGKEGFRKIYLDQSIYVILNAFIPNITKEALEAVIETKEG